MDINEVDDDGSAKKDKKDKSKFKNSSYKCQFCDKSFPRLGYLKKHEQVSWNYYDFIFHFFTVVWSSSPQLVQLLSISMVNWSKSERIYITCVRRQQIKLSIHLSHSFLWAPRIAVPTQVTMLIKLEVIWPEKEKTLRCIPSSSYIIFILTAESSTQQVRWLH